MAVDVHAQAILNMLAEAGRPPIEQTTPLEARANYAGFVPLAGDGAAVATIEPRSIGGVPALVVTPLGEGPFPVLVWIHGGGWVIGSAAETIATAKDLAAGSNCIVVSLDYRLAPEWPAPAAFDDCLAATTWVLEHGAEIGADATRVAVGGDSAGGNLSALVALALGDRLRFQVLVYPATDLTMSSRSIIENADGYLLTKASVEWFVDHYLSASALTADDCRISPLFASDESLANAAPAFVITAGFDPLRDEGEAYVARLQAVGVDVVHQRFDGQIHAFFQMPVVIADAVAAIEQTCVLLRNAFS
jgi:acetyl esterase